MINKEVKGTEVIKQAIQETLVFLFKSGDDIISAVSFNTGRSNDRPVMMMSLSNQKAAYPTSNKNRSFSTEPYYLIFGASEVRFVWRNKELVTNKETSKVTHFDKSVSLLKDIFSSKERINVEEFEVFSLTFSG